MSLGLAACWTQENGKELDWSVPLTHCSPSHTHTLTKEGREASLLVCTRQLLSKRHHPDPLCALVCVCNCVFVCVRLCSCVHLSQCLKQHTLSSVLAVSCRDREMSQLTCSISKYIKKKIYNLPQSP